jgi:hypothetical protein
MRVIHRVKLAERRLCCHCLIAQTIQVILTTMFFLLILKHLLFFGYFLYRIVR